MKKLIDDSGAVLSVRAHPDDAVAGVRRLKRELRERFSKTGQSSDQKGVAALLSDGERDLLLLAIAQKLGIL
jgi:hypothetical protein